MADEERVMIATREEMKKARLDLAYRDYCAHLLIPLNKCRRATYSMPFECTHERHAYEKCQYLEYVRRTELFKKQKK